MSINYIGEHLLPGVFGQSLLWISFITSLAAAILFTIRSRPARSGSFLLKAGSRSLFAVQAAAVLGAAAFLYYAIFRHYFEYSYVWQYSSKSLPVKYIISCFWAGQEGSFLVWAIWQAIIGLILMRTSREWESPVMAIFALSQAFLVSMMLGIHLGGIQVGSSPFQLLRQRYMDVQDSIFTRPDYLSMITDGNGLNPLLENIWMTIHPPILFMGYALALVPFSYATAALMRGEYTAWLRPAIRWTLLSLVLLGAGILLGGAWAYVSLTFGGFWAWDPVENSSLVPWMILMAALHLMLIARRQHFALLASFLFTSLGYIFVLYATYLTRSGVLAESSAHSFGENGLSLQLVAYILVFLVLALFLIGFRFRRIYDDRKEILLSREFWMFTGAIIIILAAFQVMFTTSIPVFNKIFGTHYAPPSEPAAFYNRWQTPFALLIAGFIAFSQFLTYDTNDPNRFIRRIFAPVMLALALTIPFVVLGVVTTFHYILFLFFILLAIISTLANMFFATSRPRNWPAMVSHLGLGIFLLGVLITFSNARIISANTSGIDLGSDKSNRENLLLMKGDTLYMSGFYVVYSDRKQTGNITEYRLDFLKRRQGKYRLLFTLHPTVNVHPTMGAVYNPDTKHFLGRDYYTYIAAANRDPDYIVIKAISNPYINVLWLGAAVMIGGIAWAFGRRL